METKDKVWRKKYDEGSLQGLTDDQKLARIGVWVANELHNIYRVLYGELEEIGI